METMTIKEHIGLSYEYEKLGKFNEDINPVDWNDCYPVTDNFPYVEKNIFKKMGNYFKNIFVINPFMRKQNKKVFKTRVLGRENLKGISSAIVTSNHYNMFDCLAIRYALKENKIKYCVAEYNNRKGFLGNMMRAGGIMPLSGKYNVQKKFSKAVDYYLAKGRKVVFYPEQAMWYMYEKPRPFRDGAYFFAVKNNVPIVPMFTTFSGTGVLDKNGVEEKTLTVHIMPPIYPNPNLKPKENIEWMKEKNYNLCKEKYEEFYHKKLEYLK